MSEPAEVVVVRGSLPRGLLILLGLASAVIVTFGLRTLQDLIGPVFLALVLTIVTQPLRYWLQRKMPSWAASVICLVAMYAILLGLALALVISAARFATSCCRRTRRSSRTSSTTRPAGSRAWASTPPS